MTQGYKIAVCWLGSCAGCDMAILDINEELLELLGKVEVVFWPIAMDFKQDDLTALGPKSIDLCIIHGSIRNTEQEEMAGILRQRSKVVLALGSCACFGGTPGLANYFLKEEILKEVYLEGPTVENPEGVLPRPVFRIDDMELNIPDILPYLKTLDQVIQVDYYLPGCPPPPELILNGLKAAMEGNLPPLGSTLAPRKALCDVCERNSTKPRRIEIKQVKMPHQVEADPDTCFLAQGIICLGFATRAGCDATCISTNTPCRGCFGPMPGVIEGGAKIISALSCLIKAGQYGDPRVLMDSILDPAGLIYRFSQPSSILWQRRRSEYGQ